MRPAIRQARKRGGGSLRSTKASTCRTNTSSNYSRKPRLDNRPRFSYTADISRRWRGGTFYYTALPSPPRKEHQSMSIIVTKSCNPRGYPWAKWEVAEAPSGGRSGYG